MTLPITASKNFLQNPTKCLFSPLLSFPLLSSLTPSSTFTRQMKGSSEEFYGLRGVLTFWNWWRESRSQSHCFKEHLPRRTSQAGTLNFIESRSKKLLFVKPWIFGVCYWSRYYYLPWLIHFPIIQKNNNSNTLSGQLVSQRSLNCSRCYCKLTNWHVVS